MKKYCLIYWMDEGKVSIEAISSVPESARTEGKVADIQYRGRSKRYQGKVLKISEDKQELEAVAVTEDGSLGQHDLQDQSHPKSKTSKSKPSKEAKFKETAAKVAVQQELCKQMLVVQKDETADLKNENKKLKRQIEVLKSQLKKEELTKAKKTKETGCHSAQFQWRLPPKR